MYEHILVALDHSPLSDEVLKQAIILAKSVNARLHLLHVLSPSEEMRSSLPMMPLPEYYPTLSIKALELYQEEWQKVQSHNLTDLEKYRTEAEAVGVKADCRQLLGRPGPAICEAATDLGADLIMVGRRGNSVFDELLLGSVSSYVIHHATCAVLVCNPKPKHQSKARYETSVCSVQIDND